MPTRIVYKREGKFLSELIFLIVQCLFWLAISIFFIKNFILVLIVLVLSIFVLVLFYRIKYNFIIQEEGIFFFKLISNRPIAFLPNDQIDQIRFEDGFRSTIKFVNGERIFVYPKAGTEIKIRINSSGFIPLEIGQRAEEEEVIKILKHYQNKQVDIKIATSRQAINKALNLKNWNES